MLLIFMHLDELDHGHLSSIATTGTDLNDSGITTVNVCILRCNLVKQLSYKINFLSIFLSSSSLCRNFCYRVENFKHFSSGMQS